MVIILIKKVIKCDSWGGDAAYESPSSFCRVRSVRGLPGHCAPAGAADGAPVIVPVLVRGVRAQPHCQLHLTSGPDHSPHPQRTLSRSTSPTFARVRGQVVWAFVLGPKQLGILTAKFPEQVVDNLPADVSTGIYYGWASVGSGDVHGWWWA